MHDQTSVAVTNDFPAEVRLSELNNLTVHCDSALAHRFVGLDYGAAGGSPVRKDIGVQPIAITTARVRFSF